MKFLDIESLKEWYDSSLYYSGFSLIYPWVQNIWQEMVIRGNNALPPGFIALLLEKLVHQPTGKHLDNQSNPYEQKIIEIISSAKAFSMLEGEFILAGSQINFKKAVSVIDKIIEKTGNFSDSDINFFENDINYFFSIKLSSSSGFKINSDYIAIIENLYSKVTNNLIKNNNSLDDSDLFEINHPELFTSPIAKSFYRKISEATNNIKPYILGEINLREENQEVVLKYGEQQVLPLGGYESLINRGDISSLVPSELVFIDNTEKVDYFDYKYLENELLYYKREEGSVFRIRRSVTLSVKLTHGMEHEKNLSILFAFCLVLINKLIDIFTKDIIEINLCFYGYLPSEINSAINFFQHFISESNYDNNIFLHFGKEFDKKVFEKTNYQHWVIGPVEVPDKKFIKFEFPDLNYFALKNNNEKFHKLANIINRIIEQVAEVAYS